MNRRFLAATVLLLSTAITSFAQQNPLGIKINKVDVLFEKTPDYTIGIGPKRKANSQDWLVGEVDFSFEPRDPRQQFLDDLTFNYYILLANESREFPKGTLLTGTINHTAVAPGRNLHSVAFVSPRTLARFFGGKAPASASQATQAVGVTISNQGQVVAEESVGKGKGTRQWWTQFQQGPPGYVLDKQQTPFAPLFWDYYEATKLKPAGY